MEKGQITADEGSSPRMRGALAFSVTPWSAHGIIPAYAGSTWHPTPHVLARRDHPRVCGEHCIAQDEDVAEMGSSPRMRGARDRAQRQGRHVGIIPAYAGSTSTSTARRSCARDHPRVCGEH